MSVYVVIYLDKEDPTIVSCPESQVVETSQVSKRVTWNDPVFTDNVEVTQVTSSQVNVLEGIERNLQVILLFVDMLYKERLLRVYYHYLIRFRVFITSHMCFSKRQFAFQVSGSSFSRGSYRVFVVANDQSNNTAECAFTIRVKCEHHVVLGY